jgi:hypothetical protein
MKTLQIKKTQNPVNFSCKPPPQNPTFLSRRNELADTSTDAAMRTTGLMMGILFGAAAFPIQVRPRRQDAELALERARPVSWWCAVLLTILRWLRAKLFAHIRYICSAHLSRVVPSFRPVLDPAIGGEQPQGKERRLTTQKSPSRQCAIRNRHSLSCC